MRQRLYTTLTVLMCVVLQAQTQALTERYNKQRPAVIVSDNYQHNDIAEEIAKKLGINCIFTKMSDNAANNAFDNGEADVIITARDFGIEQRFASKCILGYDHTTASTFGPIRFVGRDHQLIEQIDDQYMRMKQSGEIAEIQDRWEHPELSMPEEEETAIQISDVLLITAALLLAASLLIWWHIRSIRKHTKEVSEMINQTKLMKSFYEIEDNQAAHDLAHKYEAILCNPYIAIAFYDNNGKLVVENDVMKRLGNIHSIPSRQPLYNANGEIANYITTFVPPTTTTTS